MRTETQGRVKGRKNSKVVKFIICVHFHLSLPMTLKRKWEFLCACVYASLFSLSFFSCVVCFFFYVALPSPSNYSLSLFFFLSCSPPYFFCSLSLPFVLAFFLLIAFILHRLRFFPIPRFPLLSSLSLRSFVSFCLHISPPSTASCLRISHLSSLHMFPVHSSRLTVFHSFFFPSSLRGNTGRQERKEKCVKKIFNIFLSS